MDFINPGQGGLFLPFRVLFSGEADADFEAVIEALEGHAAMGSRGVAGEAVLAGGDDGGLQGKDAFILEAGGIGEVAGGAAGGGGQADVCVHFKVNALGVVRHGYRLPARATSQASRQSGQ